MLLSLRKLAFIPSLIDLSNIEFISKFVAREYNILEPGNKITYYNFRVLLITKETEKYNVHG